MTLRLFENLHQRGLISDASLQRIRARAADNAISVHWELKTLLYLGILLLCGGLGILVYKNIDTIGHQFVLLFIAAVSVACFVYCFKNKLPFSAARVPPPNNFFDYSLLLGCSAFIIFVAYFQYEYNVFGTRYGLASFLPMLLLFFCAYYFDHLGILSMAIINLAGWLGITITPMRILTANDFNGNSVILTGLALGVLLFGLARLTRLKEIKKHFEFTYLNFATHILFISSLAGLFHFRSTYLLWFIAVLGLAYFFYRQAVLSRSFYFILVITLYVFIAVSYVIVNLLVYLPGDGMPAFYLGCLYFIFVSIWLAYFLIRTNRKLKTHDSL